ncbi:hypothetical protein GCM10020295_06070 [Streptomyces cinereospinus]
MWELFLPGIGEGTPYKFEITSQYGHRFLKADPMARRTQVPPETASIVTASHHEWGDQDWMAHRGTRRCTGRRSRCTRSTCRPGGRGSPTGSSPRSCPATSRTSASPTSS